MLLKDKYMCLQDKCNIEIFSSPEKEHVNLGLWFGRSCHLKKKIMDNT